MKLGFIGSGNMASAIMGGICKRGIAKPEEIMAADISREAVDRVKDSLHVQTTLDNHEAVSFADVLFLAVKPQFLGDMLTSIQGDVRREQVIVSIAPGKSLSWLEEHLGSDKQILRTMPNTPALVGEGMSALCSNGNVTQENIAKVLEIFESFGKAQIVQEHLMDTVVAVSSSSPAYVFMFIEAMADAAVAGGMPRSQAYEFAAQAVLGSAKMVLETGRHPGELKDMVCSPAGTTIEAVRVLEAKGFRSGVMEAMRACEEKSRSL